MKKILVAAFCLLSMNLMAQEVSQLSEDEVFIGYLQRNVEVSKKVTDVDRLEELLKNEDIERHLEEISDIMGFENLEQYTNHVNLQNEAMRNLEERFQLSQVSKEILAEEIREITLDFPNIAPSAEYAIDCGAQFTECQVDVLVDAAIEHLGCVGLDATIFGGALCHGVVIVRQVRGHLKCDKQYQNCINH